MPRARNKKSPAHGATVGQLAATWAANSPWPTHKAVAREVIENIGHLAPEALNGLIVGALLASWRKKYRPATAYNYRSKLRQLLAELELFGAPKIKAPRLPAPQARPTVATGDELHRLLVKPQPWLRLFILLYLQCGLRRSEAMAVTPRTYNEKDHAVTIRIKGGRIRSAQVTEDVEILFRAACDPDPDTSYIVALRGKPISPEGVRKAWLAHRKQCGVNPEVNAHDLRRTGATILYHATKDLRIPQQLLGHKNLASTLTYLAPMAPNEARRYAELLRFDKFHSEVKQ